LPAAVPQAAFDRAAPRPAEDATGTTHTLVQRFVVPFSYPVVFTWDALTPSNRALVDALTSREPDRRHRVLVVADAGFVQAWPEVEAAVGQYVTAHADQIELVASPLLIPGGETCKNDPSVASGLLQAFARHRLDRHSFVVTIGGGGVLDAVGFAAGIAHRGIRIVRMPTTVLGQNDSGVGVKNAVNAFGSKNFLGTFVPPFAVVNDFRFLERLPRREKIAGIAEAVKVSLIRDGAFFSWLEEHADALAAAEPAATATMIRRCAELHLQHIATSGDPFEHGSARPLDFGHWSAHKLEALTAHELRHGEAVAIGLLLDSRYAVLRGLLPVTAFDRIFALLSRLGLPRYTDALRLRAPDGRRAVLAGLDEFREHLGGELTVTQLCGIGQALDVNEMDPLLIEESIRWLETKHAEEAGR
jgi:3-dehydroquinate synthase